MCKQLPFYFYVYFEGSPPSKRSLSVLCGGNSPILYVLTFPWKYFFFSMKWERSKGNQTKESPLHKGEVLVLVRSLEVWEQPQAHVVKCPSLPQENMLIWELPLQQRGGGEHHTCPQGTLFTHNLVHKVCNDHEKDQPFHF